MLAQAAHTMSLAINILCSVLLLAASAISALFSYILLFDNDGGGKLWAHWGGLTAGAIAAICLVGGLLQFGIGLALDSIVQALRAGQQPHQSARRAINRTGNTGTDDTGNTDGTDRTARALHAIRE